jgi:cell division initiation protein
MIDLTPLDVRKKRGDFRRILRGYDPEEVDSFMDLVADRFEELVRQNLILSERNENLESQLEALEGRESAVQEALVSAQKLREEVNDQSRRDAEVLRDQAKREADLLRAEAEAEIARKLVEAERVVRERQSALEELERSRLKFLKAFRGLLERELDAVEVEEARRPLEDTPFDLELRGLRPEREGEEVEDVETGGAEEVGPEAEEVGPEAEEVGPEEEMGPEEEDAPSEPQDAAPGVLGADEGHPVDIEQLAPSQETGPTSQEVEEGTGPSSPEAEEDSDGSTLPEEPKWLFCLLKKEGEKNGGEN